MCVHAQSLHSCLTLCDPVDCSPPGSSIPGVSQAGILEWIAMPSSGGSSPLRDRNCISCSLSTAGELFSTEPPGRLSDTINTAYFHRSGYCLVAFHVWLIPELYSLHDHFTLIWLTILALQSPKVECYQIPNSLLLLAPFSLSVNSSSLLIT